MDLAPAEIRVLGCLIEKQRTTPDAYPLTLNSLRLACNQSTNRDPVLDYGEAEVRDALHRLERKGLARFAGGAGSRAPKFRHLLAERLPLGDGEQALLCVLMLRGPQTPGELKQRAERLHHFDGLPAVLQTLSGLIERDLIARLQRRPGQKEERYVHLLEERESADGGAAAIADEAALPRRTQDLGGGAPAVQPESHANGFARDTGDAGRGAAPADLSAATPVQQIPEAPVRKSAAVAEAPAVGELERLRARVSKLERDLAILQQRLGLGRTP